MKFKLYRYDFGFGHSLGGCESLPGTEFHLTDKNDYVQFVKRQGIDDKYWKYGKYTGYARRLGSSDTEYKFVKYVDEKELIGQLENKETGEEIVLGKVEIHNSISCLELSDE